MEDIYLFWFYLCITKKNKELGNIWKYLLYILRKHTLQILYNRDTCDLYKRELITAIHNEKSKLELNFKKYQLVELLCMFQIKRIAWHTSIWNKFHKTKRITSLDNAEICLPIEMFCKLNQSTSRKSAVSFYQAGYQNKQNIIFLSV